ncbi:MAG: class I tRNA ligase family protein, partial [Thermoplasmata archaeon]
MLQGYSHREIEKRWQDWWESEKIYWFDFNSEKPYYSIDNPPRYASGALHMGHATHYTHIDFVARYKRLRGYNVFFPLCFDVNGTPIEVNVEKKHGITKKSVSRQEFIRLCSEFAEGNIAEMTRQFKILGESMDPSIYYQTDASYYRRLTQISFIRLFKNGLVYKGTAPVNWCPR